MDLVQSAIEVRALAQQAKSGTATLQDVSLTIDCGELVAIIGARGSGKTTFLDTMCGLRSPAAGTVSIVFLAATIAIVARKTSAASHRPVPSAASSLSAAAKSSTAEAGC